MLRRIPWAQGLGVGMLSLMLTVVVALPAQAVYPIEEPPGPPRNVVAVAGDGTAVVAWQVPDSTGSDYPIWSYRVTSVPPSSGCPLVLQPGPRSCEVTGLANGTSYIFFVSAGNIAGYGQAAASNPVTPQADKPVITISAVRSGGSVSVAGTTKNVPEGAVLSSWVRLEGESSFVQKGPATARADNAFAWRLEVPPDKGVEVYFTYEGVQSNVASAAADAQTSLAIGGSRNGNAVSISGLSVNVPMGSSITLLTRVNGLGDFAAVGTAVVGDGLRPGCRDGRLLRRPRERRLRDVVHEPDDRRRILAKLRGPGIAR